jgi:hypothetical protein
MNKKNLALNMAIKPIWDSRKREFREFGAILFGPPDNNNKEKIPYLH